MTKGSPQSVFKVPHSTIFAGSVIKSLFLDSAVLCPAGGVDEGNIAKGRKKALGHNQTEYSWESKRYDR
jgi:hypothetical protein